MKSHTLKPAAGSSKRRRRVGCGTGSGRGKTCGRGAKGQRSRGRTGLKPWFEGGQMPLARRLPKKGFNHTRRHPVETVNLADLSHLSPDSEVSPELLREMGLVEGRQGVRVKILAEGDVAVALRVRAHAFSSAARAKIIAAGGSVEEL